MNSTKDVEQRLQEHGYTLPSAPPQPAGLYEPFRLHGGIGFLAAQVPGYEVEWLGRVGEQLTPEKGQQAAARAALNALSRIREALGGFERLAGLLHVAGHVASADNFRDQPWVLDGASRLFRAALLERGRHTRTAFAPLNLPRNISVELEITFAYQG